MVRDIKKENQISFIHYLSPSITMTGDLPQVFKEFRNIMADVKLVVELSWTSDNYNNQHGLVLNNPERIMISNTETCDT